MLICHTVLWVIWDLRNNYIFSGGVPNFGKATDKVISLSWYWFQDRGTLGPVYFMSGLLVLLTVYLGDSFCLCGSLVCGTGFSSFVYEWVHIVLGYIFIYRYVCKGMLMTALCSDTYGIIIKKDLVDCNPLISIQIHWEKVGDLIKWSCYFFNICAHINLNNLMGEGNCTAGRVSYLGDKRH